MNASWVAAFASLASTLVVAVTAIAAFVQIRHVRNANEISVYLRLAERLDSLETGEAIAGIDALTERVRSDRAFRTRLTQPGYIDEFDNIESLLRFLEHFSTLIITGGVSERLFLAEYADNIESIWDRLAETIYIRRVVGGPYDCAAFEHLAMRAKRYLVTGGMSRLYGRLQRDPRMDAFESAVEQGAPGSQAHDRST